MSICPSCGGVLGKDCFNPVECAQISASMHNQCQTCETLLNEINYLRDVDMKALEQDIQYACKIISDLLEICYEKKATGLSDAEQFYREHHIEADKPGSMESNYIDDDLPF